jgi:hypothetical protein
VFQVLAPWLPESRRAIREIAAFVVSRMSVPVSASTRAGMARSAK